MVLRAFWNIGAGLVHRLVNKQSMNKGVIGVSYPSVWKGRTGFLDCDLNLHLNNSSYLYSMELARWHFCAANGILWQALKNRRMVVVGSQAIRYRHAIPPFHAYEIKTQVVYWDDDWIYLLHQVQDPTTGKQFAEGVVRGVVMKGRRRVSANKIFAEVSGGEKLDPPKEMPDVVKGLLDWDEACSVSMREAGKKAENELETNPPPPTPEKLWARLAGDEEVRELAIDGKNTEIVIITSEHSRPACSMKTVPSAASLAFRLIAMVGRIMWNVGAGLMHRALNKAHIRPGMGIAYPSVWRARPGFLDCDINLHLNNASYLFNMELARWHFCAVTGILGNVARNRRTLLVGSQAVRFRHPIPPFRPYEVQSQLVFADKEWMYVLHKFQCPTTGKLYAEGLCRATCRQDGEQVSAAKLYAEVFGGDAEALQALPKGMPDVVAQLLEWDSAPRLVVETPAEAARRQTETVMSSADDSNVFKKILARVTCSWNLPV